MSTLRSLKKPKKHRKNIWFVILALVLASGLVLGGITLARKDKFKPSRPVVKTEIIKEK